MTALSALLEDLIQNGADATAAARAVIAAFELGVSSVRDVRGLSADAEGERRFRDRLRKQAERAERKKNQASAKANDVASDLFTVSAMSADTADRPCESGKDSRSETLEVREKNQTSVVERVRRATRLSRDALPAGADREFARAEGMGEAAIDKAWSEFVDYWIAVPGQRGTKLDWSATWRNRVRTIARKPTRPSHDNGKRTVHDAARDLLERVRGIDGPGHVRGGEGAAPVRRLPPG